MDLGADAAPDAIGQAVQVVASSGEADALVVTLVATRPMICRALVALSEAADVQPQLPIVAVIVRWYAIAETRSTKYSCLSCRRTRSARSDMPVGMHAGAAVRSARSLLSTASTAALLGASLLRHWPRVAAGNRLTSSTR